MGAACIGAAHVGADRIRACGGLRRLTTVAWRGREKVGRTVGGGDERAREHFVPGPFRPAWRKRDRDHQRVSG